MSFILNCDFWFCCGSANDPESQPPPPYPQPTQQQTQVVTMLPPPAQQPPHISFNQLPPPLPAPALPPTFVYNLHPPGTTPSPHVPNGKAYYLLPPGSMEQQPAWPSTPLSHVPSFSKEYNVPRPMTQQQPSCQSTPPSKAYDPLPQPTQMTPSRVPSTKMHEPVTSSRCAPQADHSSTHPSNTYQTPYIANQQWTPPKVPSKRHHETIVPTVAPPHAHTPAPSKIHNPLQRSKQAVPHTDAFDEPPLSHITSEYPSQEVYPARQLSKAYQNLPSMKQQSIPPYVPSKRHQTPVPAVAPTHPPVSSKVGDPLLAQSKKTVVSCVPSTKEEDKPTPAQVLSQPPPQPELWLARQPSNTYQKSATIDQQLLAPPHAPSKRYETPAHAVAQTETSKGANHCMEYYSEARHEKYFSTDGCQQYY